MKYFFILHLPGNQSNTNFLGFMPTNKLTKEDKSRSKTHTGSLTFYKYHVIIVVIMEISVDVMCFVSDQAHFLLKRGFSLPV